MSTAYTEEIKKVIFYDQSNLFQLYSVVEFVEHVTY